MAAWALGAWFAGAWGGTVWATGEAPAPTPEAVPVGGGYPAWAEVDMARRRRKKREAEEAAQAQELGGREVVLPVAAEPYQPVKRVRNKLRDVGNPVLSPVISPVISPVMAAQPGYQPGYQPGLEPGLAALEAKVIKLETETLIADEEAAILLLLS